MTAATVAHPLLTVSDLTVEYATTRGRLRAVDAVDLTLDRGSTLALVGESGCGKTTLARAVMRLVPVRSGRIELDGTDLLKLSGRALRQQRRRFQMIFQDPASALNGRMTVGDLVGEPLAIHGLADREQRGQRVAELLELVGLDPAGARRFPRTFSGGQRQRIAIARALASGPELLVADEPTSALDVSIQGQILLLLDDLRQRLDVGLLLITHDLAVVRAASDAVAVMYLGQVVERTSRRTLFATPAHPYTRALLGAAPRMGQPSADASVRGEVPSSLRPPTGCRFHPRCPHVQERCRTEPPMLRPVAGSIVACHRAEELPPFSDNPEDST